MVDDDCDGLIDCLDPDCVCKPARKDPTILTFVQSHLDRFRSQATLDIAPLDLGSMQVGVLLTNPNGVIYNAVLAPGDLSSRANGTIFQFRDPAARTGHGNPAGIYNLQIKQHRDQKGYTIKVEAYADLSRATDPMMRIQFYLGDNVFITTPAPWKQMSNGWRAPKDH